MDSPEHLCSYGCGKPAKYQFKNGKWCCSKNKNSCKENIKSLSKKLKGKKYQKIIIRENPGLCDYGCGNKAIYYLKSVNRWCCSKSQNSCVIKRKKSCKKGEMRYDIRGDKNPAKRLDVKNKIKIETKNSWNKLNGKRKESIRGDKNPSKRIEVRKKISENTQKIWDNRDCKERKQIIVKNRKTNEERRNWIKDENLEDFVLYTREAKIITEKSAKEKFSKEELKTRGRFKNHIDHIFSIQKGFFGGILPQIIGSKSNIRLINCNYNLSKNKKCDITKEELFKKYEEEIKGSV